ncbi:protein ripply2.1-like [Pelodytes ibericus]
MQTRQCRTSSQKEGPMDTNRKVNPRISLGVTASSELCANTVRCENLWRPWNDDAKVQVSAHDLSVSQPQSCNADQEHVNNKEKLPDFHHPVKLFWPKSRCYDFLYGDAENLLKNFPVQATISFYDESDGGSSSEDEDYLIEN